MLMLYMWCIVFGGVVLYDFVSVVLDDYVKLFFFNVYGEIVCLMIGLNGLQYEVGVVYLLMCDYMFCYYDV